METVAQVMIALTGVIMIYLLSCRSIRVMRWGFVASLTSQPFWIYSSVTHQQWGMLLLTCVYIVMSIRGIRNHWQQGG